MKIRRGRLTGLAIRISLGTLVVALLVIVVLTVGVLVIARFTFDALMVQAGDPAATAQAMFDGSVAQIFVVAAAIAVALSAVLSVLMAVWIARPVGEMSQAARRIAAGDYAARVPRTGPAEITSLADSFNQMARSLEDQELVRRDFIVNAAHELRTPLTNLQGYLEALRDGVAVPSAEQFSSLHEEVQRLVRLAQSLDHLADGSAGESSVDAVRVDLTQVLRAAVEMGGPGFDLKSIRFEAHIPEELTARGDIDRFAQVFSNLLQNAARYTPRGGRVNLRAEEHGGHVQVTVTNSGDGIPPDDLPRVFERFYRVEKSRDSDRGGAGIGLAIVKQLIEADGGTVGADSEPGQTRFWLRLPA